MASHRSRRPFGRDKPDDAAGPTLGPSATPGPLGRKERGKEGGGRPPPRALSNVQGQHPRWAYDDTERLTSPAEMERHYQILELKHLAWFAACLQARLQEAIDY